MPKDLTATKCLIGINILIFALSTYFASTKGILRELLPLYFPLNGSFHPWQFVTTMFMHGSPLHLFMNMFALFSFGTLLERIWGAKRFLIFYFAAGIGASLVYTSVNYMEYTSTRSQLEECGVNQSTFYHLEERQNYIRFENTLKTRAPKAFKTVGGETIRENMSYNFITPAVGASGAIYGILVAFGMLFPNAKLSLLFIPVPVAAKYIIPALLGFDLFSEFTGFSLFGGGFGGGIAHFAHLGGALSGFLLMMLWKKKFPAPQYAFRPE